METKDVKQVGENSQTIEKRDRRFKKHHEMKAAEDKANWAKKAAETTVGLLQHYHMI